MDPSVPRAAFSHSASVGRRNTHAGGQFIPLQIVPPHTIGHGILPRHIHDRMIAFGFPATDRVDESVCVHVGGVLGIGDGKARHEIIIGNVNRVLRRFLLTRFVLIAAAHDKFPGRHFDKFHFSKGINDVAAGGEFYRGTMLNDLGDLAVRLDLRPIRGEGWQARVLRERYP